MSELSLRPRYYYKTAQSIPELTGRLKLVLEKANSLDYKITHYHLIISFPKQLKHFWSPEMDINMEQRGKETFVRVLIGPAAAIWTLFMFIYTIGGLLISAGFAVGYSQYILHNKAWALYMIPAGIVIMAATYLAGQFGKYKAEEQVKQLKGFFDAALPELEVART